jgi:myosin heavy subunit
VQLSVPLNQSFELTEETDYSDMCKMNVLNEPEVLSNIIRRYKKDEIFTSIGPTLIVVNPYRKI